MYPTTLFVSPKQGGILQCSGFLDLQSLVRLSQTAKAHAFDELSLIQLIENEVTVRHQVTTVEGAILSLQALYKSSTLLRQWLDRDSSKTASMITPTREMIFEAVHYDVMLAKMMRAVSKAQQLQILSDRKETTFTGNGVTVLHWAAYAGNPESIKFLVGLWPEAQQRFEFLTMQNSFKMTVLHYAAISDRFKSSTSVSGCKPEPYATMRAILNLLPESEHLRIVGMQDSNGSTALHYAARSDNSPDSYMFLLSLYPESERLRALYVQDSHHRTVLHYVARSSMLELTKTLLPPEALP